MLYGNRQVDDRFVVCGRFPYIQNCVADFQRVFRFCSCKALRAVFKLEISFCLVSQFFDRFGGQDTLIYVDPAMADNGVLYTGFTPEFAKEMGKLCGKADVIVPNLTEASFMLGVDYVGENYDEAYIRDLLKQLTGLGCKTAVLTGVSFAPGQIGAMAYDAATDTYASYFNEKLPVSFHGTGDVFASACVGALMNGKDLAGALKIAVDYTLECIRETQNDPDARWYGVNFESAIPMLVHSLGR